MVTARAMNMTLGRVSLLGITELCDVTQASLSTTKSSWNDN